MKYLLPLIISIAVTAGSPGSEADRTLPVDSIASLSAGQCLILGSSVPPGMMPQTFQDGQLVCSDLKRWTSGFFPGTCWYSYLLSSNEEVRSMAESFTDRMLDVDSYFRDHDIGFQTMCSAGLAYKITKDDKYLPSIRRAAELLAARFSPITGTIKSWNSKRPVSRVIVDNMMNLELLTFASRQFGVPEWMEIAESHADKTIANHFREDGSSFHLVEYDPGSGAVLVKQTVQGYSDDSAWSRGQAWGLYGFTMMYRETGQERYLHQAEKIARFLLPLLAGRPVPAWDFNAPEPLSAQDDASAAAIMASAFVELGTLSSDKTLADRCSSMARTILEELASPRYLAAPGEIGGFLLKHSTGHFKAHSEVDVPLTYADYYFLEALCREFRPDLMVRSAFGSFIPDVPLADELGKFFVFEDLFVAAKRKLVREFFEVAIHQEVHRKVFVKLASHAASCRNTRCKDFLPDIRLAGVFEAEIVDSALIPSRGLGTSPGNQYFIVNEPQAVLAGIFLLGRVKDSTDNFFTHST